jgi:hypothetical protein
VCAEIELPLTGNGLDVTISSQHPFLSLLTLQKLEDYKLCFSDPVAIRVLDDSIKLEALVRDLKGISDEVRSLLF